MTIRRATVLLLLVIGLAACGEDGDPAASGAGTGGGSGAPTEAPTVADATAVLDQAVEYGSKGELDKLCAMAPLRPNCEIALERAGDLPEGPPTLIDNWVSEADLDEDGNGSPATRVLVVCGTTTEDRDYVTEMVFSTDVDTGETLARTPVYWSGIGVSDDDGSIAPEAPTDNQQEGQSCGGADEGSSQEG